MTARDPDDIRTVLESEGFVDRLAVVEHERWAHWQRYLHAQCERNEGGSLVIPAELVARWSAQMDTPFRQLTEAERESDRDQVRRYLPLIVDAPIGTPNRIIRVPAVCRPSCSRALAQPERQSHRPAPRC